MPPDSHETRNLPAVSLPKIQASVDQQVTEAVTRLERLSGSFEPIPISFTARCEKTNILRWLQRVDVYPRVFWRDRDGGAEVGGIGSACTITSDDPTRFAGCFQRIRRILRLQPGGSLLGFFGGTRFDPQMPSDRLWQSFPALWFVLPRLIVTRRDDDFFMTAIASWDGVSEIDQVRKQLYESVDLFFHQGNMSRDHLPRITARVDMPDRGQWSVGVAGVLSRIDAGSVDKVVLARRSDLQLSGVLDPSNYLEMLVAQGKHCFGFLLQPDRSAAFVGLTPERLFRLTGNHLLTEAVAGTVATGDNAEETAANAVTLSKSDKNRREQRYVVDDLRRRLAKLCDAIETAEEPEILQLSNVQHLVTRLEGSIKPTVGANDILSTIHPTAAVCGTPIESARALIREAEPFDRGWYSSAVGVIADDAIEMAVAIRSALITGRDISLFAGAGIVAGSAPDLEWRELESKIAPALNVLAGGS